jgi:hypothetical protein
MDYEQIQKWDMLRLDGGLNQGEVPTHIDDNQLQELVNFYVYQSSLYRRNGLTRVTATAHTENITTIAAYKKSTGVWELLIGSSTEIAKLDGNAFSIIPPEGDSIATSDDRPMCMRQYKDVMYIARPNMGTFKRCDGLTWADAGIAAPTTAATLAEGAAGALPAANYIGVVTFYNSSTAAESDFSDASNTLALTADHKIDWTAIPVATTGQVNARRLYRTMGNQTGRYYLVAQINDNTTTTYTDNVLDGDLGQAASLENGVPPAGIEFIEIWRERLWASDGTDLWLSRALFPESIAADMFITVFPDDGHKIRGMLAFGDRMLVGKTNAMHYIVGSGPSDFQLLTLSNVHGLASGHSLKAIRSIAVWYGGDDFYMTDGTTVEGIGDPKIKDILSNIPESKHEYIVSWIHPTKKWYVTTVPQDESGENIYELVFNYENGTWQVFEHGALGAAAFGGEFFDDDYGRIMYASYYDAHLYQWHEGATDAGASFTASFKTKSFGYDAHSLMKAMRRIHILTPKVAETLTANLYRDNTDSILTTRTFSLYQDRKWKRVAISNMRELGATLSLEFEYSGDSDIHIDALAFEIVSKYRSSKVL